MDIYFYQEFSVINIEEYRSFSKRDFPNPKKNVSLSPVTPCNDESTYIRSGFVHLLFYG